MNRVASLFFLLITLMCSACANTKVANNDSLNQAALKQASQSELTPEEAILAAAKKVAKAEEEGLSFYAPLHMKKAQNKLSEAQKLKKKIALPEDKVAVISTAFAVDLLIENANKNKVLVTQHLVKSLQHKTVLEELGTNTVLPKAFGRGMKKLEAVIKDIEGGLLDKAIKGQEGVLDYFAKIEAETLESQHLTKAVKMKAKAKGVNADDLASKTFTKAENKLKRAKKFIKQNYRDREGVKRVCNEAYNAAAHAYHVAMEVEKIIELKEEKAEEHILYVESLLQRVNSGNQVENLTSMSLYDQSVALSEALGSGGSNQSAELKTGVDILKAVVAEPSEEKAQVESEPVGSSPVKSTSVDTAPVGEGKSKTKPESTIASDQPSIIPEW